LTLLVGDMHFGRGSAASEREKEAALIGCLRAHAAPAERLVLMGDIFDTYIEYRTLVPKGFARFKGLLAEWTDRGVPVTYLTGNHDLWHRGYFERELGVEVVATRWVGRVAGRRAVLTHGDAYDASDPLYPWMRPLLRSRAALDLYRRALPAGGALALAQAFNRRFHEERVEPERVRALRHAARRMLRRTSAQLVAMGHSHYPERRAGPGGTYLNTGAWHRGRTFARVTAGEPVRLFRWNGSRAVGIEAFECRPSPVRMS
jgi:UDP-2,3-diacylglucosamine hydrolase